MTWRAGRSFAGERYGAPSALHRHDRLGDRKPKCFLCVMARNTLRQGFGKCFARCVAAMLIDQAHGSRSDIFSDQGYFAV